MAISDFSKIQDMILKQLREIKPIEKRDRYGFNQQGLSNIFADVFSEECCFIPELKHWYIRNDGIWVEDCSSNLALKYLRALIITLEVYARDENLYNDAFNTLIKRAHDFPFQSGALKQASSELNTSLSLFDNNPYLLNFKNGVFDFEKKTNFGVIQNQIVSCSARMGIISKMPGLTAGINS